MNLFSYIKQRVPILDVVNEYATLKKAGLYWKGCCPFHHERTASFTVSPHKEIFYCFGCHAGGDVISFIAKVEHCSPLEAAQHLVERHHIELPKEIVWEKDVSSKEGKNQYFQTCLVFAQWCHNELKKKDNAQEYLAQRHITQASIQEFVLGYCPHNVKGLLAFAQKQGILAANLIDAHILMDGKQGLYSPFEERIIFPIKDHLGRFVGFGGRTYLPTDDRAKYYNSHDHAYFNKGTILFGLDRAKKNIAQAETVFLVEGYTDLIIMNQYGFTNTVATLGTACTQEHLQSLARYAQKLFVVYDGDTAGQNAIMRLAELSWNVALDLYVIILASDHDPASFLLAQGDLAQKIEQAVDIFSFIITYLETDFLQKSTQDKLAITKKVISIILALPDPLKQELLLAKASHAFNIPAQTLKQACLVAQKKTRDSSITPAKPTHQTYEISQLEKKLFSAILNLKDEIEQEDQELLSLWLSKQGKNLFTALNEAKKDGELDLNKLFETVNSEEKQFVSGLLMENPQEQAVSFHDLLLQFYKKQWKIAIHDVKLKVYEAQQAGNGEQVKKMLSDINELKNKMLRRGIHG